MTPALYVVGAHIARRRERIFAYILPSVCYLSGMHKEMSEIARLFDKGALNDALAHCDKLVEAYPESDKIRFAQGMIRQKKGDGSGAIESYRATISIAPNHLHALVNLGALLFASKRTALAIDPLQKALQIDPNNLPARSNLAHCLFGEGDVEAALDEAEAVRKIKPDSFDINRLLNQIYDKLDRVEDAVEAARRMVELEPERKEAKFLLVANLQSLGKFGEAEQLLKDSLSRIPDDPDAHIMLTRAKRSASDEKDSLQVLNAGVKSGRMAKPTEITARFAIADLLDRAGEYDEAFAAYRAANQLQATLERYDRGAQEKLLQNVKSVFTTEFFETRAGWGDVSATPVFVVGMPRSGTTLTEQILARHPLVRGFGERGLFEEVCNPGDDAKNFARNHAETISSSTEEQVQTFARTYLQFPSNRSPETPFPVDKTPGNIFSLGLISLVFPNAQLLFCRRDPLDVCLSIYRQHFVTGQVPISTSFENIVHYYDICEQAFEHFQQVLPVEIKTVSYEHLVSSPDDSSDYLLGMIGLEGSEVEAGNTAASSIVRTASAWQVRQPIYNTSVQKWRHYEKHLGALIEGLAKYLPE